MAAQVDTREVQVQQVNGSGFKADGAWLNISKFAPDRDVAMPSVGARVTVSLDKAGFVRKIEPIAAAAQATTRAPASAAPDANLPNVGQVSPTIAQDDRGVVVTRLAVLNTATAILSSNGRAVNPDEVLGLAARLEAWATR